MPLTDVHLKAYDQLWDIAVRGNVQTVYILSATAVFILLIAILNFINLFTARAVNRVKEVGVRKVVGALRGQLINQFISESVIVAFNDVSRLEYDRKDKTCNVVHAKNADQYLPP